MVLYCWGDIASAGEERKIMLRAEVFISVVIIFQWSMNAEIFVYRLRRFMASPVDSFFQVLTSTAEHAPAISKIIF